MAPWAHSPEPSTFYHHAVSFNWNELLENPEGIESSALERVVGIGKGRVVKGVSVELHSLEIRELGSFGLMRTDIGAERTHPEHLLTGVIAPEIAMDDGIGTHTRASWWPLKVACKARDRASASATASRSCQRSRAG